MRGETATNGEQRELQGIFFEIISNLGIHEISHEHIADFMNDRSHKKRVFGRAHVHLSGHCSSKKLDIPHTTKRCYIRILSGCWHKSVSVRYYFQPEESQGIKSQSNSNSAKVGDRCPCHFLHVGSYESLLSELPMPIIPNQPAFAFRVVGKPR